jgi:hypothetical protein
VTPAAPEPGATDAAAFMIGGCFTSRATIIGDGGARLASVT